MQLEVQGVAGTEALDHIVVGGQLRIGLAPPTVRYALVDHCLGDRQLEVRGVAGTEALDHIVIGGQLRIGLTPPTVRDALVEQRLGNLQLEVRDVAGTKALDHIVVGGQFRIRLAPPTVCDALAEQRLGNLHLEVGYAVRFQCPLKALADSQRLRRLNTPRSSHLGQFVASVEYCHELNQVTY